MRSGIRLKELDYRTIYRTGGAHQVNAALFLLSMPNNMEDDDVDDEWPTFNADLKRAQVNAVTTRQARQEEDTPSPDLKDDVSRKADQLDEKLEGYTPFHDLPSHWKSNKGECISKSYILLLYELYLDKLKERNLASHLTDNIISWCLGRQCTKSEGLTTTPRVDKSSVAKRRNS